MRGQFDAWTRGDLAGVVERVAEDALVRPIIGPEWQGPQGFLEMATDWIEGFDEFTVRAEEFVDARDNVVVRVHQEAHGASTGVPVQVTFWWVYSLKDGKIVRLEMFDDREPALNAAEVSEQDAHSDSS